MYGVPGPRSTSIAHAFNLRAGYPKPNGILVFFQALLRTTKRIIYSIALIRSKTLEIIFMNCRAKNRRKIPELGTTIPNIRIEMQEIGYQKHSTSTITTRRPFSPPVSPRERPRCDHTSRFSRSATRVALSSAFFLPVSRKAADIKARLRSCTCITRSSTLSSITSRHTVVSRFCPRR